MKRISEAILVFIFSGIIFAFYFYLIIPEAISNINKYFFSTNHDGIKNYFTYLYYLKYDKGFQFTGMAYPYGDLITFTDNQPLLVLCLKLLGKAGLDVSTYSIGIFNSLLLLSFPVTCTLLYKILKHYGVSMVYSFAVALAITLINPQIERLNGHYALAYSFVIPLLWLIDIKANRPENNRLWVFTGIFITLLLTYIHVYYLAVSLLFFAFSGLARIIFYKKETSSVKQLIIRYALLTAVPVFAFKIFMSIVDHVTDRVSIPYGFLNYRATYRSIFFSTKSPLYSLTPDFIKTGKYESEGAAYLGFFGLFFLAFLLFIFFREWARNKKFRFTEINLTQNVIPDSYLLLAIFALCISTAFPLYMPPFDVMIEWLKPLAQFRSPGRFAWIFFFIVNVYFFVYLYQLYQRNNTVFKRVLLPFVLMVTLFEGTAGTTNFLYSLNVLTMSEQFFRNDLSPFIHHHQLNKEKYQAIIALPFTAIGTEKVSQPGSEAGNFYQMKVAFQTGIPLVDYMMSRTSVKAGLEIAQLTSNSVLPKEYPASIKDVFKPFLLMVYGNTLSEEEKEMISIAKPLFNEGALHFYEVSAIDILSLRFKKQALIDSMPWKSFHQKNVFFADSMEPYFFSIAHCNIQYLFDNNESVMTKEGTEILYEGKLPDADSLVVSFWARSKNEIYAFPVIILTEYNENGEEVMHYNSHLSNDVQLYKSTRKIEYKFKPHDSRNNVKIQIKGKRYNYSSFVIQKANTQIRFKDEFNNWFWNNYPLIPFNAAR